MPAAAHIYESLTRQVTETIIDQHLCNFTAKDRGRAPGSTAAQNLFLHQKESSVCDNDNFRLCGERLHLKMYGGILTSS